MKQLLTKAMASLAVVTAAGFGSAAMASAASAETCAYPFAVQTATGQPPAQCWPTNTVADQPAIASAPVAPDGSQPPDGPSGLPATVSGVTPLAQTTGSLAFTGADVWQTVLVGVVLIGGGGALVRLSRRRGRTRTA